MFSDLDIGMDIWYHTDSSVFNLRRIQSKDQGKDWYSADKFSVACDNFGLTISTKKTEVMHQPTPVKPYVLKM